jgi:Putative Actinobacterial Holin-X, holin superfamily III
VHVWFLPSAYSWFFAGLIVGVFYFLVGGSLFLFSWGELKDAGVAPVHTLEVLKEDQIWIKEETRAA